MGDEEVLLPGSRLNRVVRVGDTVRRTAGPWTPTVHALLRHVRERGCSFVAEPLGIDDQGREVLTYIPGDTVGDQMPWPGWVWDDGLVVEVGRTLAAYHRAVADFRPAGSVPWQLGPAELGAGQIVCHHDVAPYNVVTVGGRLRAVIDWDLIGPGTARSDLAFAAWQWVPLQHPAVARLFGWGRSGDVGPRLRLMLDSYGLERREGFVDEIIARAHLNRTTMLEQAAEGVPAYVRLVQAGHVEGMTAAIDYLTAERDALERQLT